MAVFAREYDPQGKSQYKTNTAFYEANMQPPRCVPLEIPKIHEFRSIKPLVSLRRRL